MRHARVAVIAFLLAAPLSAEHVTRYDLPLKGSSPSATVFLGRSIFVSTGEGVYRIDLDQFSPQWVRIFDGYLPDLVVGPDGALWAGEPNMGSGEALLRLDPADHSVDRVRTFSGENIWGVAVGTDGLFSIVLSDQTFDQYRLVRVTTSGEIVSSVAVPEEIYSQNSQRHLVTTQGLWWVEPVHGGLKLLTATGDLQSFAIPFTPLWLASGGDFLWVVGSSQVARVGLNGVVLALHTTETPINGAAADGEGDLWLRETGRLTEITRDGVYVPRDALPPYRCPDAMDYSIVAFSEIGEIAVTDPLRRFMFELPNNCLHSQPNAFDTVTVMQPGHGGPHDIPSAGPAALVMLAVMLAMAGAVLAARLG